MKQGFPLIVAHNGYDNTPLNSLTSIISGIKKGADYIEIDIRVTKDGIPVLFHDDHIITENGGFMKISELLFSELEDLIKTDQAALRKYLKPETLDNAVITAKEHGGLLNLDMKDGRSIDSSVNIVRSHKMTDSVVFSGCNLSSASYLKQRYPELQVMLNLPGSFLTNKKNHTAEKADEICRMAVSVPCCGININHMQLYDDLIKSASLRYLPVSIWTLSDQDNLDTYLNKNIFSITTLALNEILNKKNNKNGRG